MDGIGESPLARPLRTTDAEAVTELMAECELADQGEVTIELADIVGDWQRPSFDLAADSRGVFDGDRMLAYAEVYRARRAEVYVRPAARGRGIGTALMRWTWRRAREAGGTLVGQTVPERLDAAVNLFRTNGYRPLWTSWILALPPDARIPAVGPSDGYAIRPYRPGEERAVHRTIEDAFNEWPNRDPYSYDDWAAAVLRRPGFEPWHLLAATDPDDRIVGACYVTIFGEVGWVNQVAVRADRRGLGLGKALLAAAFAATREHGATRAELNTDSRTGALGLYLRVGMRISQTFTHYAKDL